MQIKKILDRWLTFIASKHFFYLTVGIFLIGATWLAFTSRYPMAFDENYHYEIIQTYAKQWSPFFSSPPAGTEQLGDITRYPSYLFHYLFSLPYRLLSLFTESNSAKIIVLRLLNVGMLASSFWLCRRLFEHSGLSRIISNLALFVFALIPIVPFLGAQISYDNATIPLTLLTFILAVSILKSLKKSDLDFQSFLLFISTGLFTSLIKYTYLPIFVTLFLYISVAIWWAWRKKQLKLITITKKQFASFSFAKKMVLCGVLLLGVVLGVERYGINVLRYKNPVPDCNQILSVESCKQYGPWGRDYILKQRRKTETPKWRIADYNKIWWRTTLYEFFFAINHEYVHKEPIKVLYTFAQSTLMIGLLSALIFVWRILKHPFLRVFALTSAAYAVVIWIDNYMKFTHVHWPVAIHGRYLLPVVPLAALVMGYGIKYAIELVPKTLQKAAQALLVLVLVGGMLFGGGALTYIARSEPNWYWQNNVVVSLNTTLRRVLINVLQ